MNEQLEEENGSAVRLGTSARSGYPHPVDFAVSAQPLFLMNIPGIWLSLASLNQTHVNHFFSGYP
jgi:hypothetical protein